jgi:hypothetical protein
MTLSEARLSTLAALAGAMIPADEIDGGAASVQAAPTIAARIEAGIHAEVYTQGLDAARSLALQKYGAEPAALNRENLDRLLGALRETAAAFFQQLRMDVTALYLSDPEVWRRIGFPGPSTLSGGYPDFDQPQTEKVTVLKDATKSS